MSSEPKPFASLSSGLLARKGAARPAMRPQGFSQLGPTLEDLGWNDMGFEPPKPAAAPPRDPDHDAFGEVIPAHPHNLAGLTPVDSPVHGQQAELAGRLSAYSPDDSGEEEEIDETAELYDPEAEAEAEADAEAEAEADAYAEVEAEAEADVEEACAEAEEPGAQIFELKAETIIEPEPEPAPVVQAPRAPVERRPRRTRAEPGTKDKAAFTLRLDPERHLKLRLASAVNGRSAQLLVTKALDELLAAMPELNAMAEKAKRKG